VDTNALAYAHRALAAILNGRGVYSQAEVHARQSLALDPANGWAALQLSNALLALKRPTKAAAAAGNAIRLSDGGIASMHFAAGAAYFDAED